MDGVDTNDQLLSCQHLSRTSYRCWMPIFFDILKQAIVTAQILRQLQQNTKICGLNKFYIELSKNLIGSFSARKISAGQHPNATKRYDGFQHFVVKSEKRGYCKMKVLAE